MPEEVWRPNLKLPADLRDRATILRIKLGYPSLQDWAVDVFTWVVETQEADLAEQERKRRSR